MTSSSVYLRETATPSGGANKRPFYISEFAIELNAAGNLIRCNRQPQLNNSQIGGWLVQENIKCNLEIFKTFYFALVKNINKVTENS